MARKQNCNHVPTDLRLPGPVSVALLALVLTLALLAGQARAGAQAAAQPAPPQTVAVLDLAVPTAERNRWGWAEAGVADLLQIELQQRGLVTLDRDLIHAVPAVSSSPGKFTIDHEETTNHSISTRH